MRSKIMTLALLAAGAAFGQVSIGVNLGAPPPPRVVHVRPHSPGAGYSWVDGYWYPSGNHYVWHDGYWTRPPYGGARWMAPRYETHQYYQGYWEGDRGKINHDHRWDKERDHRDYNRGKDHDDHDRDHR